MGRRRHHAQYGSAPLRRVRPWRRRHPGVFHMFELNAVGWSALLGAGSVPSLLLWVLGTPPVTALALGEASTFSAVKVRDHLRWRASAVHMLVDGSPEVVQAAVADMRATGLAVEYEELPHDVAADESRWQPAVTCRQADSEVVRAALRRRAL